MMPENPTHIVTLSVSAEIEVETKPGESLEDAARLRFDAFRDSVLPSVEWGIHFYSHDMTNERPVQAGGL